MSTNKKRVLIIDDSPTDIRVVMENLKSDYAVLVATNGKKGIEVAGGQNKPDVILMDVEMPDMDGYEVCRRLKQDPQTQDIDIIFVSAHNTLNEKLAGYEAGGRDYVIKPVEPVELLRKVKLSIEHKQEKDSIEKEKNVAFHTAMDAMSYTGEQGIILEFLQDCFNVNSYIELAELMVEAINKFDLSNTVQIRAATEVIHHATVGSVLPLEQELLSRLSGNSHNRIVEKGSRAIFSFDQLSVLVKNMPDDEAKRGRLRDHLAMLLNGAEQRLNVLIREHQLVQLVVDARHAVLLIDEEQEAHRQASQDTLERLLHSVEQGYSTMGLTLEQESHFSEIIQDGVAQSLANLDEGMKLGDELKEIINRLIDL